MSNQNDGWQLPHIISASCTGCGDCVVQCPVRVLGLQDGKAVLLHPSLCTYCAVCEEICPSSAIELPLFVSRVQSRD